MKKGSTLSRKLIALAAALILPYLIFIFVIKLNEMDMSRQQDENKQVNFEVKKQQKIRKKVEKKSKKTRRKKSRQSLPGIKPGSMGNSLGGMGLSFGLPQFDEANFDELKDEDLLDSDKGSMDKESVDTIPKVKKRSPLVYPELARRQGISGYVVMNVLIDEQGNVEDVEIVDSKPKEIFDLQAESTIRQWKFSPATYNGQNVKVWATQKIVFKLN